MSISATMGAASTGPSKDVAYMGALAGTLHKALKLGGYPGIHLNPSGEAKFHVTEGNPPKYDQGVFTFRASEGNYALRYEGRGEKAPPEAEEFNDSFQGIETESDFLRAIGDVAKAYWPDKTNVIDATLSRFSQEHVSPAYLTLEN